MNICIQFNEDKPFCHITVIPGIKLTYKDLIQRLHLKWLWRYVIIAIIPNQKENILIDEDNDNIIPSSSLKITLYKTHIQPFFFYNKIYYLMDDMDKKTSALENVNHIVVWLNYNVANSEPIVLYMIYKENGKWKSEQKTSTSFEEVEDAILSELYFSIFKEAKERFYELKEEYNIIHP